MTEGTPKENTPAGTGATLEEIWELLTPKLPLPGTGGLDAFNSASSQFQQAVGAVHQPLEQSEESHDKIQQNRRPALPSEDFAPTSADALTQSSQLPEENDLSAAPYRSESPTAEQPSKEQGSS